MTDTRPYADLTEALARLGAAEDPSEFHGLLCGALCVQEPSELDPVQLIDTQSRSTTAPDAAAEAVLGVLRDATVDALISSQMRFTPVLPDDGLPLATRVQALALWCQGFLYGLASRERIDFESCSEEAREIIRDLSQFTQAGLEAGDDEEIEEAAYAELVEYVRVGAQLLFIELNPNTRRADEPPGNPTLH